MAMAGGGTWTNREAWVNRGGCTHAEVDLVVSDYAAVGPVIFASWGKKMKGPKLDSPRMIVITPFTISWYKRKTFSKKIVCAKDCHLYELRSMTLVSPDLIHLMIVENGKESTFEYSMDPLVPMQMVYILLAARARISVGRADPLVCYRNFKQDANASNQVPFEMTEEQLPAYGGFVDAYLAHLLYNSLPVPSRASIDSHLARTCQNMFLTMGEAVDEFDRMLDLESLPGIVDVNGKISHEHLDAAAQALAVNRWFTSIQLHRVSTIRGLNILSKIFAVNTTITELGFSETDTGAPGVIELAKSIELNQHCALASIDLSGSPIRDKGVSALATVIPRLQLASLNLANCDLKSKGLVTLIESLMACTVAEARLGFLNLSGNSFGKEGSEMMGAWFHRRPPASLQTLMLANADLHLVDLGAEAFSATLQKLATVEALDLSGNVITSPADLDIGNAVQSMRLSLLRLNEAKLPIASIVTILTGFLNNTNITAARLEFSGNDIGAGGVRFLGDLFCRHNCGAINGLNLANAKLEAAGVEKLCDTLQHCPNLRQLDISYNMRPGEDSANALKKLCTRLATSKISVFTIQGNEKCNLGSNLVTLMQSLTENRVLSELDIEGNRAGDAGAAAISNFLRSNSTVTTLNADGNKITMEGLRLMAEGMKANKTLVYLGMESDVALVGRNATGRKKDWMAELSELVNAINNASTSNREMRAQAQARLDAASERSSNVVDLGSMRGAGWYLEHGTMMSLTAGFTNNDMTSTESVTPMPMQTQDATQELMSLIESLTSMVMGTELKGPPTPSGPPPPTTTGDLGDQGMTVRRSSGTVTDNKRDTLRPGQRTTLMETQNGRITPLAMSTTPIIPSMTMGLNSVGSSSSPSQPSLLASGRRPGRSYTGSTSGQREQELQSAGGHSEVVKAMKAAMRKTALRPTSVYLGELVPGLNATAPTQSPPAQLSIYRRRGDNEGGDGDDGGNPFIPQVQTSNTPPDTPHAQPAPYVAGRRQSSATTAFGDSGGSPSPTSPAQTFAGNPPFAMATTPTGTTSAAHATPQSATVGTAAGRLAAEELGQQGRHSSAPHPRVSSVFARPISTSDVGPGPPGPGSPRTSTTAAAAAANASPTTPTAATPNSPARPQPVPAPVDDDDAPPPLPPPSAARRRSAANAQALEGEDDLAHQVASGVAPVPARALIRRKSASSLEQESGGAGGAAGRVSYVGGGSGGSGYGERPELPARPGSVMHPQGSQTLQRQRSNPSLVTASHYNAGRSQTLHGADLERAARVSYGLNQPPPDDF